MLQVSRQCREMRSDVQNFVPDRVGEDVHGKVKYDSLNRYEKPLKFFIVPEAP